MKVNGNPMNALSLLVFSVVVAGSLGGYAGYQAYPQPVPAPYFPFPYNVATSLRPAPFAIAPPPALRFAPGPPADLPQHYYSPPGNTYRGFSYHTDYPNGGSSQVVFVTGPQSSQLLQQSFASFRHIQPAQTNLRVLTVTPKPKTNLQVLAVSPTTETNSTSATASVDLESVSVSNVTPTTLSNALPLPLPNAVFAGSPTASVYRVQVFPSHLPQYPHFLQAPFPYHPIFPSFYNALAQVNRTGSNPITHENAHDGQESMINEVGALPVLRSNHIDNPTTAAEASVPTPASEPVSSSSEPATSTSMQESSSTEEMTTSAQESSSMEAATTIAQESSNMEAGTSESVDVENRMLTETSSEAAEHVTTSDDTNAMKGDSDKTSEATSTASALEESVTTAASTESSGSSIDEQTTQE